VQAERNTAKLSKMQQKRIRNQQVAGSIPAGGSIIFVLKSINYGQSTNWALRMNCLELAHKPAHRNLDAAGASGTKLLENTEMGQFRRAARVSNG